MTPAQGTMAKTVIVLMLAMKILPGLKALKAKAV